MCSCGIVHIQGEDIVAKISTLSPLSRIKNLKRSPKHKVWELASILRMKKSEEARREYLRVQAQNAEDARDIVLLESEVEK